MDALIIAMKTTTCRFGAPKTSASPSPRRDIQAEFQSLIPHSRALLSLRDLQTAFSVSHQQVRNWIESGLVVAGDIGCGTGRRHYKVTRASAYAFYAWRFGWDEEQSGGTARKC
jgi:hypothetical protein